MKTNILIPEKESTVTPSEYIRLSAKQQDSIESVHIEPPTLGKRGFGRLIIKWKYPRLAHYKYVTEKA